VTVLLFNCSNIEFSKQNFFIKTHITCNHFKYGLLLGQVDDDKFGSENDVIFTGTNGYLP
jgi:hypothetical protein